jgi:hypothetical protein
MATEMSRLIRAKGLKKMGNLSGSRLVKLLAGTRSWVCPSATTVNFNAIQMGNRRI